MTHTEVLQTNRCPNCWSNTIKIEPDYLSCPSCGLHGNPKEMRWCDSVPVFKKHEGEGQLYKHEDTYLALAGYAPGCGRYIPGAFCSSCRKFLPAAVDKVDGKSRRQKVEAAV